MSGYPHFDYHKLHQVSIAARAASASKIDDIMDENGDAPKRWVYPAKRALRGLCATEERLWRAEMAEELKNLFALFAATAVAIFMVVALVVQAEELGPGPQPALFVTFALAIALMIAWLFSVAFAARRRLREARIRGYAKGADGAFVNHGRSLVAIGTRALYVARNREDIDGSPVITVVPFEELSNPIVDVFGDGAMLRLELKDGELVRNLIFHGDSLGAFDAADEIRYSNGSPSQAFNSLRRLERRVSAV